MMFPDEAVVIYLYLKEQPPEDRNEEAMQEAWRVICDYAKSHIGDLAKPVAPEQT